MSGRGLNWSQSNMRFILLLISVSLVGYSKADVYHVPMNPVSELPFMSINQFPLKGNPFQVNETHIFWPVDQNLFSKFYMNLRTENEEFYGISQQNFIEVPNNGLFNFYAPMANNDHLAIVKARGPWKDTITKHDDISDTNQVTERFLDWIKMKFRLNNMAAKNLLHMRWLKVSNIGTPLFNHSLNIEQFKYLKEMHYGKETELLETKLLTEMDDFSSGLSKAQYSNFSKTTLGCLHIKPDQIETTKVGQQTGWWIPLKKNILGWRVLIYQKPIPKATLVAGLVSMNLQDGNLNVMLQGTQFFKYDMDSNGLDATNMRLDISPPNNIPDSRAPAPRKPSDSFFSQANLIRTAYSLLPDDHELAWESHELLCPKSKFEQNFNELTTACGPYMTNRTDKCIQQFLNFYPCFNYYLRPSHKSFKHGMDSIMETLAILHIFQEAPFKVWKRFAQEHPWDEEFLEAEKMFDFKYSD